MVQWHWQDVSSSAHFLPLQGWQRGRGDGDGGVEGGVKREAVVGGGNGIGGEVVGRIVGGDWVLDGRGGNDSAVSRRMYQINWLTRVSKHASSSVRFIGL